MLENAVSDIPRFYTALAEWLSCNLFVLLLGPKIKIKNYILFSAIYLIALAFFLEVTATIPLLLWILCMILAFLSIVGFIWLCNRISIYESIFFNRSRNKICIITKNFNRNSNSHLYIR